MSEQHQTRNSDPLNPNLVAVVLIINFIFIGGLLAVSMPLALPQSTGETHDEVALVNLTPTLQPSNTPLPAIYTPTQPPAETLLLSATPQVVATIASDMHGHTAADYDPALAARGAVLFAQCAACHGADARGIPNLGKDLVASEFLHSLTDAELVTFIKTGRPLWDPLNTTGIDMPPKGGNPALTDDDIMAIIAYIHSLVPPTDNHADTHTETLITSATPQVVATIAALVPPVDNQADTHTETLITSATPQVVATIVALVPPADNHADTHTETLITSATPQVVATIASDMHGHTAADYDPALAARGEVLFAQCAACHGADARGIPNLGKDLVASEFLHSLTDAELVTFIKTGRPLWDPLNTTGIDMPPKGGNPALTDDDIMAIIAYIHSLVPPTGE